MGIVSGSSFTKSWVLGLAFLGCMPFSFATNAADTTYIPVPKNVIYAGQIIDSNLLRDRRVPMSYLNRVSVFTGLDGLVGESCPQDTGPQQTHSYQSRFRA